ncbi:unnamed protein product [Polarella glacialis]|uniref:Uncharacterized protein n=1 Tax=Polarella glacialis TaxID=89957 RepID=A0A813GB00_POLGL|nr:unnamed protein product [Polarella glacialis]
MSDDADDYHNMELSRRSIQIFDIQKELTNARARVQDAEDRSTALNRNLGNLKVEIAIRDSKAKELQDEAVRLEARGKDAAQAEADAAAVGRAQSERLQQEGAQAAESLNLARASAEDAQRGARDDEAEVGAVRIVLEMRQREIAQVREDLAADEAEEEAREARRATDRLEQASMRVGLAERAAAKAAEGIQGVQVELARLETGLAMEKEGSEGLRSSLASTEEKRREVASKFAALEKQLEALGARCEAAKLGEALATSKQQHQRLQQDVAGLKHRTMLETQSVQGALDETRRMMSDHLSETQRHLDETTSKVDSPYVALLVSLSEAKETAALRQATRRRLQQEADALEAEVRLGEAALREELSAARQELQDAGRRGRDQEQALRSSEAAAAEAERGAVLQERLLREKLQELWAGLGVQVKATDSDRRFDPPPRQF